VARHGHLVARAPVIARSTEGPAGDFVEHRVVVELAARLGTEVGLHARFEVAQQGHGFRSHLEAQSVLDERRVRTALRTLARMARGHRLLDLAQPPSVGPPSPCVLGLGGGHPAELAHRRPIELSPRERSVENRKPLERAADAKTLIELARPER
jgi:hypothetical protein